MRAHFHDTHPEQGSEMADAGPLQRRDDRLAGSLAHGAEA